MKVLHLTRDFPPRHCGGISTAVGGLVRALDREGIHSAVVSFDDYHPGGVRGRIGVEAPAPIDWQGSVLRIDHDDDLAALDSFVRSFGPDLIQLHIDLGWELATSLRETFGRPIVATLHVNHRQLLDVLGAERESLSLAAQQRVVEGADLLVAPTQAAAQGIPNERLHVAGFTVDLQPTASLDAKRIVVVSRFAAAKGTDRLVELLPQLLEDPELQIDIVGGLPRSARRERRWQDKLSTSDRVTLHGWLPPAERDAIVSNARLFLSTSRIESFGLAVLEAVAQGVPVCGYREPALEETAPSQLWLDDNVAPTILELVNDRDSCLQLGAKGRDAIPSWSSVVAAWRAAYDRVSNGGRR